MPRSSLAARCALTAPFHPYPGISGAVRSLWHCLWGYPRRTLSGAVFPWSPDFPLPQRSGRPTGWRRGARPPGPEGQARAGGNDKIWGEAGDDDLFGGSGADTLTLTVASVWDINDVWDSLYQAGAVAVLDFGGGDLLVLANTSANAPVASDFLIV